MVVFVVIEIEARFKLTRTIPAFFEDFFHTYVNI